MRTYEFLDFRIFKILDFGDFQIFQLLEFRFFRFWRLDFFLRSKNKGGVKVPLSQAELNFGAPKGVITAKKKSHSTIRWFNF